MQVAPNTTDRRIGYVDDQPHHRTAIIVVAGEDQIDRETKQRNRNGS